MTYWHHASALVWLIGRECPMEWWLLCDTPAISASGVIFCVLTGINSIDCDWL